MVQKCVTLRLTGDAMVVDAGATRGKEMVTCLVCSQRRAGGGGGDSTFEATLRQPTGSLLIFQPHLM